MGGLIAGSAGAMGGPVAQAQDMNGELHGMYKTWIGSQPRAFEQAAANSLNLNTSTSAFDDYFAYNISEPITIRKNESALVPILQTKVDAERVTLWSQQQALPLRALWITNSSDLTLDRGSFTIVEDGSFGGEGLLEPVHPAEKRLLSYAVDHAIRVTPDYSHESRRVQHISISKGVLKESSTDTSEVEYVIHNAAPEARSVIIERPARSGWTLDSDPKPVETTGSLNRFRAEVPPKESVRLHIGERHLGNVTYRLTSIDDGQFTYILSQSDNNAALKQALQPILDARRHFADVQTQLDAINQRLNALRSDEDRQRANVTALNNADKSARERFVRDLNNTEDQIAAAQKDLANAQANVQTAKADLANKVESLQMDQDL